ncbi:MAG: hypothetical protein P9F19_05475, partial [Candidatus Contendobacter sp.]|nr:hypothetical protein [Candidatus Contendobacter sp.]
MAALRCLPVGFGVLLQKNNKKTAASFVVVFLSSFKKVNTRKNVINSKVSVILGGTTRVLLGTTRVP